METIADFISQEEKIVRLTNQYDSQRSLKRRAIIQRDIYKAQIPKAVDILIDLSRSGRIEITSKEIGELCFMSEKSVWEAKSRLKRARNEKLQVNS
tara:strand:+ start:1109 stop:1396 length:288 start_codon:yes stop_codon:yes gene_type:complete